MGKITGFLEIERLPQTRKPVNERVGDYQEFIIPPGRRQVSEQGARCMDCGIPYCHQGCPVNNVIPEWNDLVYRGKWREGLALLHATNNFPEFTGRVCPAPCEAACTLNITDAPVTIKSIECALVDRGWEEGWIHPQPSAHHTDRSVAIIGSGPSGLACAQQLARVGHKVVVFERNSRIGGLLRIGIPDFKMEKHLIDRRMAQMQAEGVEFRPNSEVGSKIPIADLLAEFDAVALCGGSEVPRDLPIAGRDADGIHFAMRFLSQQNDRVAGASMGTGANTGTGMGAGAGMSTGTSMGTGTGTGMGTGANTGTAPEAEILATGRHVIVIGGGDTGSDCVGTSIRQGAASVTQLEVMPRPPEHEDKALTWPDWPLKLRSSTSHEEGCARDWAVMSKSFDVGPAGEVTGLKAVRLEWSAGADGTMEMQEIVGSEFTLRADLVLLAMGFLHPIHAGLLDDLGLRRDARGNVAADTEDYRTSLDRIFSAGDMRRGQSLVVWAIREGRQCARAIDDHLMGHTTLPR